jgi:glutaredoxin
MRQPYDKNKYILTFFITAIIFAAMLFVNNILDEKRSEDVKAVQDQIALDLLSSETQFNLLKETSCKNLGNSVLSKELNSLSTKLSYLESSDTGTPNPELVYLKKYYSLLQIKDSILTKQLTQKCANKAPVTILYFYGNKSDCSECEKMSYVLTYLREQYPDMRIYSFDTNLKLSAIDTLKSLYGITATKLPAIVYNDESYVGFKSIDEVKNIIPELKKFDLEKEKLKAEEEKAEAASSSKADKK